MAYATLEDVQKRMNRTLSDTERTICESLLDDAAVIIDSYNDKAKADAKLVVSVRMVMRALGDGEASGIPMGATQGSMAGLGYSQSWTISGGSTGEEYLTRLEKKLLGVGNRIGTYSPVEELAPKEGDDEGDDNPISC